jgi:glucan phosphoethanolaminetransferase (alkaline phosphatase superfamily)
MWQRMQTIFLLLVIIAMGAMLFLPIWDKTAGADYYELNAFRARMVAGEGLVTLEYFPVFLISIVAILAIGIAAFEITQYRDRLTQMKLGALNSLIMSLALGLSVFFIFSADRSWHPEFQGNYRIGIWMPAMALIFNMLANRFIRRDENLVRSADRIR